MAHGKTLAAPLSLALLTIVLPSTASAQSTPVLTVTPRTPWAAPNIRRTGFSLAVLHADFVSSADYGSTKTNSGHIWLDLRKRGSIDVAVQSRAGWRPVFRCLFSSRGMFTQARALVPGTLAQPFPIGSDAKPAWVEFTGVRSDGSQDDSLSIQPLPGSPNSHELIWHKCELRRLQG